jgi:hypothetical protein
VPPFENKVDADLRNQYGEEKVTQHLRIKTTNGYVIVPDHAVLLPDGTIKLFESKSGDARLNKNQREGFEDLKKNGGVVIDKSDPLFFEGRKAPRQTWKSSGQKPLRHHSLNEQAHPGTCHH